MDSKIKQVHQRTISIYTLLQEIGHGGFADVYLAEHGYLKTQVALKIFRARPGDEQMQRFLVQMSKLARLRHPHILPILECDIQDGQPFLIMPYAPGGTLRRRHAPKSQLPLATVLVYLRQIASALDHAHQAGLTHGDIKPENILLGDQDELLLSDFGLTSMIENAQKRGNAVTGTVTYMAPEQLDGHPEPASDQYALAVLLYEWLCGVPPFSGTYIEVATQHALVDPPLPRQQRPELSPQVEQVLLRAMAKNPRERFSGVMEFVQAMEQAVNSPASKQQTQKQAVSRRKLLWGLAGTAGALTLGGGLTWLLINNSNPHQVSPLYTYQGHKAGVYALSWCSDGSRIASVDASGLARIWQAVSRGNTPQGKFLESRQINPVLDSQGHGSETALLWSPGANQIAFGSYPGEIHIWDITHKKDLVIRDYQTLGASLAWSPDNTCLAAVYIGSDMVRVAFWDLTTTNLLVDMELTSNTKLVGTFSSFTTPVALAWSSNGKRMALSIKDSLSQVNETHIWELSSKRALARLPIGSYDLAWSPDAEYLATDNQVWDAESGHLERTYPTNGNTVAWSPNGEYLATGGKDNSISVWEASTGKLLRIYQGHTRPINMVRWSPDSSFLASASEDRTVRIFPGD